MPVLPAGMATGSRMKAPEAPIWAHVPLGKPELGMVVMSPSTTQLPSPGLKNSSRTKTSAGGSTRTVSPSDALSPPSSVTTSKTL